MRRARVPGIIGLLLGGYVIGQYGLNLLGAGNTTVPDLGELGLLYLMFVAGVELDLGLVRIHRAAVIGFGVLTFCLPAALGVAIGFALGWTTPAALLLGALLASHTLLLYPTARGAGLAADRGVATAVGATVLTDTAALIVLAAVAGSQVAGGSGARSRSRSWSASRPSPSSRWGSCRGSPASPSATWGRTGSSATCSRSPPSSPRRPSPRASRSSRSSAPSSPAWRSTGWSPTRGR